jgi:hypothetical protein
MLDFDFSVEHVLMFAIVAFLLYHLVGRCGMRSRDGFSVGGRSVCRGSLYHDGPISPGWCLIDGMDTPKSCGIRHGEVVTEDDCFDTDGCNWFPTAVENASKNLYKCKNLRDLYVDTLDDGCSSSYKKDGNNYGHILPLNVYWDRAYDNPPSQCEQFDVCLPQNIEYIGWEDTDWEQPCKNKCGGTHTPFVYKNGNSGALVERSDWNKLGNITQSDLGSEDAGCYWHKTEWDNYDGCTFSKRALCVKEELSCRGELVGSCDAEFKNCNNKYSKDLTGNKYHMCQEGTLFGCQGGGNTCSKPDVTD